MSRAAQSKATQATARHGDQDGELHFLRGFSELRLQPNSTDGHVLDICPVCKSSRYLNKSMRFLVNPECYHKMCESCVDRIFSHGPNKCPIAGCHRTLRKHRFREQTFEDIQVEREVDIRKRIATVFNRREEEFDSLLDYNNYLNDVEDITFNLVNRIDVEATEKKLQAYSDSNSGAISENAALAAQEAQDMSAMQAAEREQARLRRAAARREEDEERRARAEGRQDVINRLASGKGNADQIAEEGQKISLKRRLDRQQASERQERLQAAATTAGGANGSSGFVIKGLKAKKANEPEKPFDAFGGLTLGHAYFTVRDSYPWSWLDDARSDPAIVAGGYSLPEFHSRALCEAFSGLGVLVGEEAAARDAAQDNVHKISTVSAAKAGSGVKDTKMEDPF